MRFFVDKNVRSWVDYPSNTDFPIQNLPYGIFSTPGTPKRVGVAIGSHILDMTAADSLGWWASLGIPSSVWASGKLNAFMSLGNPAWYATRKRLAEVLSDIQYKKQATTVLVAQADATLHLPVDIGDYTDFYSSEEHATNVGKMFRDPANALLPNWKHLPVAYHGRSSSIVVSGTDVSRPLGQTKPDGVENPIFGPSKAVDFELEVGFFMGKSTELGQQIPANQAEDAIFGFVLFNDWSARDIQRWEYVPLGPFLAKNFGSTVSPWVVTLDALEPFRVAGPSQEPKVLPYLQTQGEHSFDIRLEVSIAPQGKSETIVSVSNFKYMYWNICQQVAHHTVNGCNMRVGDFLASGTISGKDKSSFGSMLELTWGGKEPLQLSDGSERKYLLDHDTVIVRGICEHNGIRIGFGEARGAVLPAHRTT